MDYNLGPKKNCLIGNWSEESALKDYAGHYRMPHDGSKGTSTYRRCVEHSLRYEVKDLSTTNRKDFNEPAAPRQNLTYKPNAMMGARERQMMQKMQAVAAEKPRPAEAEREWETVAQGSFKWPDVDQHYTSTLGSKKMRSLDNGPIPGRDKTFVLEHRIVAPHLCLETEAGKLEGECLHARSDRVGRRQKDRQRVFMCVCRERARRERARRQRASRHQRSLSEHARVCVSMPRLYF